MLVKCKFLNEDGTTKGRAYTYETTDDLNVGETVHTANGKKVKITEINAPLESIKGFEDRLTSVHKIADNDIIDAEFSEITLSEPVPEFPISELIPEFPDNDIDTELAIIVEKLPIIRSQLPAISEEITRRTEIALSMPCNDNTKAIIKKFRASLNNTKKTLNDKRIEAKNQILEDYDNIFMPEFKKYVTDKIESTTEILTKRINEVEAVERQKLLDGVEGFFYEYTASKDIGWITWEQANIKVGISDNLTNLRNQATAFIDRIASDLELIDTQENKAEILVEYHKELNVSKAIKTVQDRIKAVKIQKELQAAAEQRKKEQEEQRRLQAEKLEQARQESLGVAPGLSAPRQEIKTPESATAIEITPQPNGTPIQEKLYTVCFKVSLEPKNRIAELSKYLKDNGYEYVQVPLKNIKEEN